MSKFARISAVLLFIILCMPCVYAAYTPPQVVITGFIQDTHFEGVPAILMQKGNDPAYRNLKYNDQSWRVSTLPFVKEDYLYFGINDNDIFWYRIHVKFPKDLPVETIGLSLGKISDVDETYLNGNLIGKSGEFDGYKNHACNKVRIYEVPTKYIIPGEDNVIAIKVKNTYRADEMPGRGPFYFGSFDKMSSDFYMKGIIDLIFPIIYFVFFAYFMLLYYKRRVQTENLLYSVFSLAFSVYSISRTDIKYVFYNNFYVLQKLEFGSMFLGIATLMAFILVYYKEKQKIIHYFYYGLTGVFIIGLIILKNHMDWYTFNVRFVQYTWIVPFGTILYVLVRNFKKNIDARIMIFSIIAILLGAFHDITLSRGTQIFSFINFWITPFTMFLFIMSIATILSIRFANFLNVIEDLNANLEQKVVQRTAELNLALDEIKEKDAKIEKELVMAGKIQKALLPRILPEWELKVTVHYNPLRQVSGDFYDFFPGADGSYMLLLADVSGHGMPAAIYTILAKRSFFKASRETSSPANIFKLTNDELCMLDTGQYLTAFMVKFDRKRSLIYSNAGHPKAIYMSKKSKIIKMLDTSGTFVGAMEDANLSYRDAAIKFEPGDKVILYTDCLIERKNIAGEEFGTERLLASIKKNFFLDIDSIIDNTLVEYNAFVAGSENKDDLTIIGLEYPDEVVSA